MLIQFGDLCKFNKHTRDMGQRLYSADESDLSANERGHIDFERSVYGCSVADGFSRTIDESVTSGLPFCAVNIGYLQFADNGVLAEVFELGDDVATVKVAKVPEDSEETCRQAVEDCPVEAISIVEE